MGKCLKKIRNLIITAERNNRTLRSDLRRGNSSIPLYFQLLEGSMGNFFLVAAAQLTMSQMCGEILGVACSLFTLYHPWSSKSTIPTVASDSTPTYVCTRVRQSRQYLKTKDPNFVTYIENINVQ